MSHEPEDDYLWDGSGTPDPDVAALEDLLRGERYDGVLPELPQRGANNTRWFALLIPVLAAAALLFVLWPSDPVGWHVEGLDDDVLEVGEWIETGSATAEVTVADIGWLELEPDSRLRLKRTGPDEHRLELARGAFSAVVDAPPRLFVVETPGATAVDLGCAYRLAVDEAGVGSLRVTSGWVALEDDGFPVLVPAGASARTFADGPGVPLFDDAPAAVRVGVQAIEAGNSRSLDALLDAARPADTLTLFHLLPLLTDAQRAATYDRIESLAPGVGTIHLVRPDALRLDDAALRLLRLDLEALWRL